LLKLNKVEAMIFIPIFIVFALLAGYLLYKKYRPQWNRQKALERNKHKISSFIEKMQDVPIKSDHLSNEQKEEVSKAAIMFFCEKEWSQSLSEEQKISESLKACLPLLNRETNFYPRVKIIEKEMPLSFWLDFHEKQFAVEKSQTQLKKLNQSFTEVAQEYFTRPEDLKKQSPEGFSIVNDYFYYYS
jgi:hypothetical protein